MYEEFSKNIFGSKDSSRFMIVGLTTFRLYNGAKELHIVYCTSCSILYYKIDVVLDNFCLTVGEGKCSEHV